MKLTHHEFEEQFLLQPGTVNVLVVEQEDGFYNYCMELLAQIDGDDGGFCLSEGDKILSFSKNVVAVDLFGLKTNEKKAITKLYSRLHELLGNELYAEVEELNKNWEGLFQKLNAESACPIEYDEDDFSLALLKTFNVRFADAGETLLEKIISFLHVQTEFFPVAFFVFFNLKTMLTQEALKQLYKEAALLQVNLFLMENTLKPAVEGEKVVLIDRDLCEILVSG